MSKASFNNKNVCSVYQYNGVAHKFTYKQRVATTLNSVDHMESFVELFFNLHCLCISPLLSKLNGDKTVNVDFFPRCTPYTGLTTGCTRIEK